jgi:hypothetical protein
MTDISKNVRILRTTRIMLSDPPYLLESLQMSSVVRASQLGMGLLLGLSLLSPAHAEPTEAQAPLSNPEANSDPFSSRGDSNGAIMQLIHRAMRGDANVDRAAESAAQRENLSEAANDFFAKRNQLKKTPATPIGAPAMNLPPAATNQPGSLKPTIVLPIGPVAPGSVAPGSVPPSSEVTATEPLTVPQPVKP